MRRPRGPVVGLCIAVIVLSAFLPGICAFEHALLEPQWVLLPDNTPLTVCVTATPCAEQRDSLRSLLPSRAPPLLPVA
jgi:hypothetical protein